MEDKEEFRKQVFDNLKIIPVINDPNSMRVSAFLPEDSKVIVESKELRLKIELWLKPNQTANLNYIKSMINHLIDVNYGR
jgi:hypothetical protein